LLCYAVRKADTTSIRAAIEWHPTRKRPRGRSRKRWVDGIRKDLEILEVTNWENRIQDRIDWITVTVGTKILTEL